MGYYGVDFGHCLSGADTGAYGVVAETEVTRGVGNALINELRARGHNVINCTVDNASSVLNSLSARVNKANGWTLDLFISIHANAGGGTGTETYVCSRGNYSTNETYNKNKEIAKRVNDSICNNLGYANRGVKEDEFYVLTASNSLSILVETFFVDNAEDVKKADYNKIAKAIADGILGETVTPVKPPVTENTGDTEVRRYAESGICTITDKEGIYFRNKPSVDDGQVIDIYNYGESVYYDLVVISKKYVWISWVSATTGERRYMPITERATGQQWAICE